MSPIIELQRRMVEVGRIRAGEKDERGFPRKLENWRLTSKDPKRLEAAAALWGGAPPRPWENHEGEFELYTETNALPIMLFPGAVPTTWYELWSAGGCQRRCDGVHEIVSDQACLCGEERECKPITRLSVLLPDLPGIGSWLLTSTGWNAAAELAGGADLLQRASAQGILIPARLRLEQRSEVKQGQTRRFAVPVIDLDTSLREILGGQGKTTPALPSGFTPIPPRAGNGATLSEGLALAESQTLAKEPRVALPEDDVFEEDGGASAAPPPHPLPPDAIPAEGAPPPSQKPLTLAQTRKKLDALVGQLREAGRIKTEHLWNAIAKIRSGEHDEHHVDVDAMVQLLGGRDEEGALHWSPLRNDLTLEEARLLHGRLARLWATTQVLEEHGE